MHPTQRKRAPQYLVFIVTALGLVLAACTGSDAVSDSGTPAPAGAGATEAATPTPTEANSGTATESATEPITQDDLVRFLAAAEAAVADTDVEGVVLESAETYIALAQASCARFDQGDDLKQIVDDYIDDTDATPESDDEQLIGAVLGAAVETMCPEHAEKL